MSDEDETDGRSLVWDAESGEWVDAPKPETSPIFDLDESFIISTLENDIFRPMRERADEDIFWQLRERAHEIFGDLETNLETKPERLELIPMSDEEDELDEDELDGVELLTRFLEWGERNKRFLERRENDADGLKLGFVRYPDPPNSPISLDDIAKIYNFKLPTRAQIETNPYSSEGPFSIDKEGAPLRDNTTGGVAGATYIGIKEAAGLVAKSTDSIRRAIRSGKLKAEIAPDGRYLIDEADVLKAFPQRPDGIKGTPAYVLELVALQTELVEARAALETSQAQIETKQARIDELEADKAQLSRAFEVISDTLASQNRRGRPLMLEAEPRKRRLWRRGGN